MKKNILFFVAAAGMLTLASCSQDTTEMADNGNVIKFRPSINAMTRGYIVSNSSLDRFNVSAFIDGHSANYFTNWQMIKSGNKWTSSDKHYWPPTQTLKFFAYAPVSIYSTISITPSEQTIKGFTMNPLCSSQADLIVAYNSSTKAANENSGVALTFSHALTMIDVYLKNADFDEYQIDCRGIKLAGFKSKADFTFPTTNMPGLISPLCWKNVTTESNCYDDYNQGKTVSSSFTSFVGSYFMVIPQQLTAWNKTTSKSGAYIAMLVRICKKEANGTLVQLFPKIQDKYAYVAVPIDTQLMPGKFYKYYLTFLEKGAGNIAPDPTNPYKPDVIDPNPGPGGEEVLGGPIKVSVSVEKFEDAIEISKNL